jgi:transposase
MHEIAWLFPEHEFGRPWKWSNRQCFDALLFLLVSGLNWCDLPKTFPSKSVVHQRFQRWAKGGVLKKVLNYCRRQAKASPVLFMDARMKSAKKGRADWASWENKKQENDARGQRARETA